MRKTIDEIVFDEMQKVATIMCQKYCKYYEQYLKDQAEYDDKNPIYEKHCKKCPMIGYYR